MRLAFFEWMNIRRREAISLTKANNPTDLFSACGLEKLGEIAG